MEKTLEQRVEELEKKVAELEKRVPEQPLKIAQDAAKRLSQGINTINQVREEYGLEPIQDKLTDKYFITKA